MPFLVNFDQGPAQGQQCLVFKVFSVHTSILRKTSISSCDDRCPTNVVGKGVRFNLYIFNVRIQTTTS